MYHNITKHNDEYPDFNGSVDSDSIVSKIGYNEIISHPIERNLVILSHGYGTYSLDNYKVGATCRSTSFELRNCHSSTTLGQMGFFRN